MSEILSSTQAVVERLRRMVDTTRRVDVSTSEGVAFHEAALAPQANAEGVGFSSTHKGACPAEDSTHMHEGGPSEAADVDAGATAQQVHAEEGDGYGTLEEVATHMAEEGVSEAAGIDAGAMAMQVDAGGNCSNMPKEVSTHMAEEGVSEAAFVDAGATAQQVEAEEGDDYGTLKEVSTHMSEEGGSEAAGVGAGAMAMHVDTEGGNCSCEEESMHMVTDPTSERNGIDAGASAQQADSEEANCSRTQGVAESTACDEATERVGDDAGARAQEVDANVSGNVSCPEEVSQVAGVNREEVLAGRLESLELELKEILDVYGVSKEIQGAFVVKSWVSLEAFSLAFQCKDDVDGCGPSLLGYSGLSEDRVRDSNLEVWLSWQATVKKLADKKKRQEKALLDAEKKAKREEKAALDAEKKAKREERAKQAAEEKQREKELKAKAKQEAKEEENRIKKEFAEQRQAEMELLKEQARVAKAEEARLLSEAKEQMKKAEKEAKEQMNLLKSAGSTSKPRAPPAAAGNAAPKPRRRRSFNGAKCLAPAAVKRRFLPSSRLTLQRGAVVRIRENCDNPRNNCDHPGLRGREGLCLGQCQDDGDIWLVHVDDDASEVRKLHRESLDVVARTAGCVCGPAMKRLKTTQKENDALRKRSQEGKLEFRAVVKGIAELECEALKRADGMKMRGDWKRRLMLKWHPDKAVSPAHAEISNEVTQEMQSHSEWNY